MVIINSKWCFTRNGLMLREHEESDQGASHESNCMERGTEEISNGSANQMKPRQKKKTNLWRFRRILVGFVEGVEGSGGAAECCSYFATGIAEAVCVPLSRGSASTRDRKLDCGMDFSFQQNYRAALSWSFSSHKHFFPFFFNLSPQSIVLNFDRTENNIDIYRIVYLINNVINNFI